MDRITIVNGDDGDDTVIKNGRVLSFPVDGFLPDRDLWALQWYGEEGEVEYKSKPNAHISNLDEYSELLGEFDRLAEVEDTPPAPLSIPELKANKLVEIKMLADEHLEFINSKYPESERLSWDKQEREARAWVADNTAVTPYVDNMALYREVDREVLLGWIVEAADNMDRESSRVFGLRQKYSDQVYAINDLTGTEGDVNGIVCNHSGA